MPDLFFAVRGWIEKAKQEDTSSEPQTREWSDQEIAERIEHTLLKPSATQKDIEKLCQEAKTYGFRSVCINPSYVSICMDQLQDSPVKIVTVVGFPLGATIPAVKGYEAESAVQVGAHEIDMVINIGRLKDQEYDFIKFEIAKVVSHAGKAPVKVIMETSLLEWEEKLAVIYLAMESGAQFVKTSTGFSGGGATIEDVQLMRRFSPSSMGVKASGGIRTKEDAIAMLSAGADLLGTSNGVSIIEGGKEGQSY